MISICIFSKDRACQLEFLLKSIKRFFKDWDKQKIGIIYKASTGDFENGYALVKQKHPEFTFIKETNFRQNVLDFFKVSFKLTMFLVDDNVFISDFSIDSKQFPQNQDILALSPRMHPRITYCYPTKTQATPPPIATNLWNWRTSQPNTDWSYPMSVDGNIFRSEEILPLVFRFGFSNPNSFEGALASYAMGHPIKTTLECVEKPTLINNPTNLVQTLSYNHSGLTHNHPVAMLNSELLSGKTIHLEETISQLKELNAPHIEFPYVLK